MPVSADSLQLAMVAETTPGVTPANPVFDLWRTTGEGVTFNLNVSESAELGGAGRFAKPGNVTGVSVSGDINFELSKFDALEAAIGSVLAADWGKCPLTGAPGGGIDSPSRITAGRDVQTFTLEKRFVNPSYVSGTVPTVTSATSGQQTVDITVQPATTATGTGLVVINIGVTGGVDHRVTVPITANQDQDAVATAVAAAIDALADLSATAAANVVTVDAGAGNTIGTATARAGGDQYFYQRYRGVTFNTLSLSASPNNPVTGSVGIVGGVPELDNLPIPGATYTSAGTSAVFTAPEILDLSVGQMLGVGTNCWTDLTINLDSGNRAIQCLAVKGDKEVVLGTLSATISGTVYFSSDEVLHYMLDNKVIGDSVITFSNADGDIYRWDFYGLKATSGTLSAGGAGQDLTIPLTFQPTPKVVCTNAGEEWVSGLILSTVNTVPPTP